jgi:hypothetical protein
MGDARLAREGPYKSDDDLRIEIALGRNFLDTTKAEIDRRTTADLEYLHSGHGN